MAQSYVELVGDGFTKVFSFDYPLLSRDHLVVLVDGLPVTYSFLDDYRIQFSVPPPEDALIYIGRKTPHTPLVDYKDGSTLSEQDMDTAVLQTMYVSQEAYDKLEKALAVDDTMAGSFNAKGRAIRNLGGPFESKDATPKDYVDALFLDCASKLAEFYTDGPFVRPEWFGADPTGVNDSAPAFTLALLAAHDSGRPLWCAGKYLFNSRVTLSNLTKGITIAGDGRGTSKFICNNLTGLFKLTFSNRMTETDIRNLSCLARKAGAGTAIEVVHTSTTSWAKRHVLLENVDIAPEDYTAKTADVYYFLKGVVLTDCWNSYINNVNIMGATNEWGMNSCIEFLGNCVASTIDKADLYYADKAIICSGSIEGFRLHDAAIVATNWGVWKDTAGGEPEFKITNSHFNCYIGGVYGKNVLRGVITGNFFKCLEPMDGRTLTEYTDILLEGSANGHCMDITIHNNQFNTVTARPTAKCLVVGANVKMVFFRDNFVRDRQIGVHALPTSLGYVYVEDNFMVVTSKEVQFDNRANCYYRTNQPPYCRAFRTTLAGLTQDVDYPMPWNTHEGNDVSLHDLGQNSKLFAPPTAMLVQLKANLQFDLKGPKTIWIAKNGVWTHGLPYITVDQDYSGSVNLTSGLISAAPTDYFEVYIRHTLGDMCRLMPDKSWFEIEQVR